MSICQHNLFGFVNQYRCVFLFFYLQFFYFTKFKVSRWFWTTFTSICATIKNCPLTMLAPSSNAKHLYKQLNNAKLENVRSTHWKRMPLIQQEVTNPWDFAPKSPKISPMSKSRPSPWARGLPASARVDVLNLLLVESFPRIYTNKSTVQTKVHDWKKKPLKENALESIQSRRFSRFCC